MLRARSPLFFEQMQAEENALKTWTVKEVHEKNKSITLVSMEPKPPSELFIKNRTIPCKLENASAARYSGLGPSNVSASRPVVTSHILSKL